MSLKGLRKAIALFAILSLFSTTLKASSEGEGKFNAGEMIMHHISDAHEIHLIGDLAIYLPVIVQTESGWDVFSSSHLYHNPKHVEAANGHQVHYYEYDDYIMSHEHIYYRGNGIQLDENGEITFPVNEITIADNLLNMFKKMTPANDLSFNFGINSPTLLIEDMTVAGI